MMEKGRLLMVRLRPSITKVTTELPPGWGIPHVAHLLTPSTSALTHLCTEQQKQQMQSERLCRALRNTLKIHLTHLLEIVSKNNLKIK